MIHVWNRTHGGSFLLIYFISLHFTHLAFARNHYHFFGKTEARVSILRRTSLLKNYGSFLTIPNKSCTQSTIAINTPVTNTQVPFHDNNHTHTPTQQRMVAIDARHHRRDDDAPLVLVHDCQTTEKEAPEVAATTARQLPIRSVSFAKTMQVYSVPSRRQLSKEELQSCYFSPDEQRIIKDEVREWATKLNAGRLSTKDVEEESRGLERCTPKFFFETKTRKYQAKSSVLAQQAVGADANWIAASYRAITEKAAQLARTRGLFDQHVMLHSSGRLHDKSSPPLNLVMFR